MPFLYSAHTHATHTHTHTVPKPAALGRPPRPVRFLLRLGGTAPSDFPLCYLARSAATAEQPAAAPVGPRIREKSGIWRVERKHAPRAPSRPKQPPLAHPSGLVGPLGAWGPAMGSSGTWVGRMVHVHGRTGPRPRRAKRPILAPVSALPATGAGRWARHGPRGPMGSVGSGLAPLGPARHLPGPTIGLRGASDGPFRPPGFWLLHPPWPFGSVWPPAGVGPSRPVVA